MNSFAFIRALKGLLVMCNIIIKVVAQPDMKKSKYLTKIFQLTLKRNKVQILKISN
jgi:hypothetical protein